MRARLGTLASSVLASWPGLGTRVAERGGTKKNASCWLAIARIPSPDQAARARNADRGSRIPP